jgi:hypothetical protein
MRDNSNRHFMGQQKAEKVICYCRKHPIVLLRSFLIATSLAIVSIMGAIFIISTGQLEESLVLQGVFFMLMVLLTITGHVFFLRVLNFYLDIMILTNYRIIALKKSLYTHDDKEIIDLHEIQDMKKIQEGIFANFINFGTVVIITPSMTSSMNLHYLPKPEYYLNRVNEAKRLYILDRRRQKFQSGDGTPQELIENVDKHATFRRSLSLNPSDN